MGFAGLVYMLLLLASFVSISSNAAHADPHVLCVHERTVATGCSRETSIDSLYRHHGLRLQYSSFTRLGVCMFSTKDVKEDRATYTTEAQGCSVCLQCDVGGTWTACSFVLLAYPFTRPQ